MSEQIYQLRLTTSIAGQFAQNITHWRFDDGGFASTHAAALSLATSYQTRSQTQWQNMLPTATILLSWAARRVTQGQGFEAIVNIATATTGTRTGGLGAAAVAPVLIGYPSLPIGRERARIFLPGITETDLVDGYYAAAYKTAIATILATVFDPLTISGGGSPVATYVLKHTIPANAIPMIEWRLSPTVGTLRRRQLPA